MTVCCAQTIRPRVAAADDNHTLACRDDLVSSGEGISCNALILLGQVIHSKMDALQLAAWDIQITVLLGADRNQHSMVLREQFVRALIYADVHVAAKLDAFI